MSSLDTLTMSHHRGNAFLLHGDLQPQPFVQIRHQVPCPCSGVSAHVCRGAVISRSGMLTRRRNPGIVIPALSVSCVPASSSSAKGRSVRTFPVTCVMIPGQGSPPKARGSFEIFDRHLSAQFVQYLTGRLSGRNRRRAGRPGYPQDMGLSRISGVRLAGRSVSRARHSPPPPAPCMPPRLRTSLTAFRLNSRPQAQRTMLSFASIMIRKLGVRGTECRL